MNGLQPRKYLEWSASYYNLVNSDDLTISFNKDRTGDLLDVFFGIDYEIDISSEIGSRIKTLKWSSNSNLVKDEDNFILAVNNIRATNQLLIQAQNNNDISTGVFNTSDEVAKLVDISIYPKLMSTHHTN